MVKQRTHNPLECQFDPDRANHFQIKNGAAVYNAEAIEHTVHPIVVGFQGSVFDFFLDFL